MAGPDPDQPDRQKGVSAEPKEPADGKPRRTSGIDIFVGQTYYTARHLLINLAANNL